MRNQKMIEIGSRLVLDGRSFLQAIERNGQLEVDLKVVSFIVINGLDPGLFKLTGILISVFFSRHIKIFSQFPISGIFIFGKREYNLCEK